MNAARSQLDKQCLRSWSLILAKGLDVGLDLPSFLEDLCLAETGEDFVKAVAGVIREIRVVLVTGYQVDLCYVI